MCTNRIPHLIAFMEYVRENTSLPVGHYAKIESSLIKLFQCSLKGRIKRNTTLSDYSCHSPLADYLVKDWFFVNIGTFEFSLKGRYTIHIKIQFIKSGIVFLEVIEGPEGLLNPTSKLKTDMMSCKTLNGIILSLM